MQQVFLQEAQLGEHNAEDQRPHHAADLHVDAGDCDGAKVEGANGNNRQLGQRKGSAKEFGGHAGDELFAFRRGRGNFAVGFIQLTSGRNYFRVAAAVLFHQTGALFFQANRSDGVTGKALNHHHDSGKQRSSRQARSGSGLGHNFGCNDTAGKGGQAGNHHGFVHRTGKHQNPSQQAHAHKAGKAGDNGFPLFAQLAQADGGAHVHDQQIRGQHADEGRAQATGLNDLGGQKCPIAEQEEHRNDKDRRYPCLCCRTHQITNHVNA